MKTIIVWRLPIKIANEANSSENRFRKARRHNIQKQRIKAEFLKEKPDIKLPCTCVLTRIAPRKLDEHDNLRMGFKWIVDSLAAELTGNYVAGRADDDNRITWEYKQCKGITKEYGILIEFIFEN